MGIESKTALLDEVEPVYATNPEFTPLTVNQLTQPLIVQAEAEEIAQPPTVVSVQAPAALPGGFVFKATIPVQKSASQVETRNIQITVPPKGVMKGETILVPLSETYSDVIDAPKGHWKDGLCDCFRYGFCHPSLLCAWCCQHLGMAQVMQRMNLDIFGAKGTKENTKNTFKIILIIFILYINVQSLSSIYQIPAKVAPGLDAAPSIHALIYYKYHSKSMIVVSTLTLIFSIYFLIVLVRTRRSVRTFYSIKEGCCGCLEDCCCAVFCGCCTVAQMLRHTGQYEKYGGVCCTDRGLPPEAPLNIV